MPHWTSPIVSATAAVVLAAVGMASLTASPIRGQELVVRDSAGFRIVENGAPDGGTPRWALADRPDLVIESRADGDAFALYRIGQARFTSDGGIVVRNGLELLWFDPRGALRGRGGGRGEGPQESLALFAFEVLGGDSVVALSRRPPSVKIFGPNGGFVRTVPAPVRFPVIMSRQGNSTWVGITFGGESAPARVGLFRERWHVVRYNPEFSATDTIASLDGRMFFGDRRRSTHVPGSPSAHFTAGGGIVVVGESDTYELRVFDAGGEPLHIIRNSAANPRESLLMNADRPNLPIEGGGARRRLDPPTLSEAPAYEGVFVANDGMIWVRRRAGPDAETVRANQFGSSPSSGGGTVWVAEVLQGQEWHVYDASGRLSAQAMLPPRFRPTEIADSRVLGVWKDELDVESIRVYRLTKTPPDPGTPD